MIGKDLEKKIDQTLTSAATNELTSIDKEVNPVVDEEIIRDDYRPEILADVDEPTPEVEPVQVAGLGTVVELGVQAVKQRSLQAEKRVTMEADQPPPIRQVEDTLVIAPADPDEVKLINEQLGGQYTKGLNFPQVFAASEDFDAATFLSKFKDLNQDLFENARRGTITFDQMLVMAQEKGLNKIVYDLSKRAPGDMLPPEDFLAGMLAYDQLMKQTRGAWEAAFKLDAGADREAAMRRAMQLSTVHSHVAANLSGVVSEYGRGLQLAGELQRIGIPEVAQELTLFGAQTAKEVEYVGRRYLAITNPDARLRFLQKAKTSKRLDQVSEIWINSILSAPPTHIINIVGNAMYGGMHNLETFVAAGFGRVRSAITGNQDRVRAAEGLAQFEGMRHAIVDAVLMAGKVGITETPTDLASKVDTRTRRAIGTTGDPREVIKMFREGEVGPGIVNSFGIYSRLSSRALLMEDEFFKALAGRAELYRIAEMRASEMYKISIETGASPQEAARDAAMARAEMINNPPEEVKRSVQESARLLTFQQDLDGFLGQLQGAMSHPLAKLFVPFFRTPVNIMKAAIERTPLPLLAVPFPSAFPKTAAALKAGGREADTVMGKMMLGTGILTAFSFASFGFDQGEDKSVIIIGAGPSDKEAKDAMMNQGFQPYSINVLQDDGTYTSITFSRLDPLSGILAMSADFAYYAQYEDDAATLDQISTAMVAGLAEYMIDMPLLQGVGEFKAAMNKPTGVEKVEALTELFAQKGTEAALSVIPGTGSFTAARTAISDPTKRSTMLPGEGMFGIDPTTLPAGLRGAYTALQRAKSRNPWFSKDLPPQLNVWGEEMKRSGGYEWEFWSPIKIKNAKFDLINKELQALGDGIPRFPRKIDGVLLSREEYNQWITMTNTMDEMGKLPGDTGYDPNTTLILQVENTIKNDPSYKAATTKAEKMEIIKSVFSIYKSGARKKLLNENAYLRGKVNSVE